MKIPESHLKGWSRKGKIHSLRQLPCLNMGRIGIHTNDIQETQSLYLTPRKVFFCIFKNILFIFIDRGEGREKEEERNINVWLPLMQPQACALTGNRTNDSLVHRPALNPLSYTSQARKVLRAILLSGPPPHCYAPAASPPHVYFSLRTWDRLYVSIFRQAHQLPGTSLLGWGIDASQKPSPGALFSFQLFLLTHSLFKN